MKTTLAAAASVAAALTLSACGSLSESTASDEASGSNATSAEPEQAAGGEDEEVEAEDAEAPEDSDSSSDGEGSASDNSDGKDGTHEFGATASYDDGLSVTVSEPSEFVPSSSSFGSEGFPSSLKFNVKLVNNTGAPFDPALIYVSMQSGNTEAEQIFDSANGMDGAPTTTVLDGRETTFPIAFGVQDPNDLVMEVNTGDWEKDSTIFVKGGK